MALSEEAGHSLSPAASTMATALTARQCAQLDEVLTLHGGQGALARRHKVCRFGCGCPRGTIQRTSALAHTCLRRAVSCKLRGDERSRRRAEPSGAENLPSLRQQQKGEYPRHENNQRSPLVKDAHHCTSNVPLTRAAPASEASGMRSLLRRAQGFHVLHVDGRQPERLGWRGRQAERTARGQIEATRRGRSQRKGPVLGEHAHQAARA